MTKPADLIITNAKLLTMDGANPRAQAIALLDGQILAVGTSADITKLAGPKTQHIDAKGRTVMPGINESHIHLFSGSAELSRLSLFKVQGFEAIKNAIRAYAAANPADPILFAGSADYTMLGDSCSMDRHILDSILPDRPVALVSPDHHTVWANTIALEKAGLLKGRALPPGNEIVMGADGLATGELREGHAFNDVIALSATGGRERLGLSSGGEPRADLSAQDRESDKALLRKGLHHLARHGITSFQNMDGNYYTVALLAEIEKEGDLLARGRIPSHFVSGDFKSHLEKAARMMHEFKSPWLNSGTIKFFMDGVLDSHTALMADDYADRAGWRGEPRFDPEDFKQLCIKADKMGLQIAVHSIGDGSTQRVLDAYDAVRGTNGVRDSRHRVEHLELVREEDFARLKQLDVVASMQPPHPPGQCGLPLEPTLSRIGQQNWPRAFPWRRIRDSGVPLIFSSDWPVSSINPWESIASALTREPWDKNQPDNRQTLHEALASYTTLGAYAEFTEHWKGMLKPGFVGDVVMLDRDIETSPADEIASIMPEMTICGGRITFQA